jgi:glycerol-3-phosphate cytidylyltransferase-like family protein
MFNQEMKFRFSMVKNERLFEFLVTPGTPWEDVHAALDEYKTDFVALEAEIKKSQTPQPPVVTEEVPQGE